MYRSLAMLSVGAFGALAAGAASAQTAWTPGAEIVGQSAIVQTNGVSNTVYLDPGGAARIVSPGGRVVPATWGASGGQLCLSANGANECWPYNQPFQAGQTLSLTSNCNATSSWTANGTNPMQQEVRPQERG